MNIKNFICKQCGQEPRQQASSRCKKCSDSHKAQQFQESRLKRKIRKQMESRKAADQGNVKLTK